MKHQIWMLLFALLFLCACVPTPTEEAIFRKDTQELVEIALEDQKEESFVPPAARHVTRECETGRDDLSVTIDADVALPTAKQIPMVHIRRGAFDRDFLYRVHHVIAHDARPIEVFPKSYYQDIAKHLADMRDSGDLDKYDSVQEINDAISEVLTRADAAPDEPVYSERDFIAEPELYFDENAWVSHCYGFSDAGTIFHLELGSLHLGYFRDVNSLTSFENAYNFENPLSEAQPMIDRGLIDMKKPERSMDDAAAQAQQIMDELGLSGTFAPVHARLAPLIEYANEAQKTGCEAAYEFLYTRSVNDVEITYTNDLYSDGSGADAPQGGFAPQWNYERVRLYLDDLGLLAFYYDSEPYEVLDVPSENVRVLPLEDALDRFEKMIGVITTRANTFPDKQIRITEIRLGLTRILEQNAPDRAYLVPSWTFFGTERLYDPGIPGWEGSGFDGTRAILTINAMDGSVIDRYKGY